MARSASTTVTRPADDVETAVVDHDRGVLVDPDAEQPDVQGDPADQPRQPAALGEVHVDQHVVEQVQPRPDPYRHLAPSPPRIIQWPIAVAPALVPAITRPSW